MFCPDTPSFCDHMWSHVGVLQWRLNIRWYWCTLMSYWLHNITLSSNVHNSIEYQMHIRSITNEVTKILHVSIWTIFAAEGKSGKHFFCHLKWNFVICKTQFTSNWAHGTQSLNQRAYSSFPCHSIVSCIAVNFWVVFNFRVKLWSHSLNKMLPSNGLFLLVLYKHNIWSDVIRSLH